MNNPKIGSFVRAAQRSVDAHFQRNFATQYRWQCLPVTPIRGVQHPNHIGHNDANYARNLWLNLVYKHPSMEYRRSVMCAASVPSYCYLALCCPSNLVDGVYSGYDVDFVPQSTKCFSLIASYSDSNHCLRSINYWFAPQLDSLDFDFEPYGPMDSDYSVDLHDSFHCDSFDGDDFWLKFSVLISINCIRQISCTSKL